jgi:hypothetical protein
MIFGPRWPPPRCSRPTGEGDVLEATATERAAFGRSGIYDVTVRR